MKELSFFVYGINAGIWITIASIEFGRWTVRRKQ